MNHKEFEALCESKYVQLGKIIEPDISEGTSDEDAFMSMISGQAALSMAMCGNVAALRRSGLVPDEAGRHLELAAILLAKDIKDAMSAQAEADQHGTAPAASDKVVH